MTFRMEIAKGHNLRHEAAMNIDGQTTPSSTTGPINVSPRRNRFWGLATLIFLAGASYTYWAYSSLSQPQVFYKNNVELAATRSEEESKEIAAGLALIAKTIEEERTADFYGKILKQKFRVKIGDELLDFPLTQLERQDVLVSNLDALIELTKTRDFPSREHMLELLDFVLTDFDPTVKRKAEIVYAINESIDFTRVLDQDFTPARDAIAVILKQYPNDIEVANCIKEISVQFVMLEHLDQAVELMQSMENAYRNSSVPELKKIASVMPDSIRLARVRFDMAMREMSMSIPAFERFINTVLLLTDGEPMGELLCRHTLNAGKFCENTGRYSEAKDIYQGICGNLESSQSTLATKATFRQAEQGLKRIDSLGENLEITTLFANASPAEGKAEMPWLVVFYPPAKDEQDSRILRVLDENVKKARSAGCNVVGYRIENDDIDSNADEETSNTFNPDWQLDVDEKSLELVAARIGVPDSPYVIMLEPAGKITEINVQNGDIAETVRRHLRHP
ncbi:MAG: hypothetical protein R3C03_10470 [Pirellulaceae bacterium]